MEGGGGERLAHAGRPAAARALHASFCARAEPITHVSLNFRSIPDSPDSLFAFPKKKEAGGEFSPIFRALSLLLARQTGYFSSSMSHSAVEKKVFAQIRLICSGKRTFFSPSNIERGRNFLSLNGIESLWEGKTSSQREEKTFSKSKKEKSKHEKGEKQVDILSFPLSLALFWRPERKRRAQISRKQLFVQG